MRQGFFKPTELAVLEQPQSIVPQCGTCRLFESCKSPKMRVWGNGERRILVVFGYPTIEADAKNYPIAGVGGTLYREQFRRSGIELSECLVTHAVICKPNKGTKPDVIDYCRPNLINTIRKHKPEVIVTVGSAATSSLIGWVWGDKAETIHRWAGYQIPSQKLNAWICPLFSHQEIAMVKDPTVNQLFADRHVAALSRLSKRPYPNGPPNYNSRITVCTDPGDAADFLFHNVHEGDTVAFDFETNCLKPDSDKAKIYSCSISNGKWSIAYPWHGRAIHATTRILRDKSIGKIGCNIKFEDRWVRAKLGVEVKNWKWDTMLAAHGQENATKIRNITSIKFQAFVKLGVAKWNRRVESLLKSEDDKSGNSINRIHEIDLPTLLEYNGLDSLYEYHVAQIQMKRGTRVKAIK